MFKKTGIHWGTLRKSNPKLYQLSLERALQYHGHLADIVRDSPKELMCEFGEKKVRLALRNIDYETETLFGWGYCTLFALALHELTSYPITLFSKNDENEAWIGHATIAVGEDQYLDIRGLHTEEEIHRSYRTAYSYELSKGDFCKKVATHEHVNDPFTFVEELEKEIIFDFARHVLTKHKLGA